MASPDVSVVTPAYNSAGYVKRALDSVRRQTIAESRLEHVVVDDGSTDGTAEIVAEFDAPSLRLVRTDENSGPWRTVNRGIDEARGEYLVVLDSDDEFRPTLVERLVDALEDGPDADFAYCDYVERYPDGAESVVDAGEDLMDTVAVGVMHRTATLDRFGGYDPELIHAEYDLLLRYRDAGLAGRHVLEPLFVYHRRADSQSADGDRVADGVAQLRERHGDEVEIRDY